MKLDQAITQLTPTQLRDVADLIEQRRPHRRPTSWALLPTEAVDEALHLLAAGRQPSLGWWEQHLPARRPTPEWPEMPPPDPGRAWQPWELTVAAIELGEDHVDRDTARDVLADLAHRHQLTVEHLADAYIALEDTP